MATISKRQNILETLRDRLAAITVAHEYLTDAGLSLYLGEQPELGEDDPDTVIVLVVSDEVPEWQGNGKAALIELPIEIRALAKVELDQPWLAVERVLRDIKVAIETEERTLGGLTPWGIRRGAVRTVEREPGSTTVGTGITYVIPYKEAWGAP